VRVAGPGLLIAILLLGGCTPEVAPARAPAEVASAHDPAEVEARAIRALALGDSYTVGQGIQPTRGWPVQLADRVQGAGFVVEEWTVVAHSGWTTADLLAGMEREALRGPYDLVGLLIGANNQFRGQDVTTYRQEFGQLLARAIALAGDEPRRVIVLSIPDWGVTPFAERWGEENVAAEIDRFNAANREETARAGAQYVDVTAASRQAAADRTLIAGDGLHPSAKMYAEWVRLVEPAAHTALGEH
jgi:lysophospholipase L1-like esterase